LEERSHVTLMMEAIRSSEMSVLARATWHNIQKTAVFSFNIECKEAQVEYCFYILTLLF
jgi:hypothetical protein